MSDETMKPAAPPEPDTAQSAPAMLAVQTLQDEVKHVKGQVKGLWITSIIALVLVVLLSAFTLLPRLFGVSLFGAGFRGGQRFNPQNGQGFNPGGTNQPQSTTPSQ